MVANLKEVYFETLVERSIVISIHSRLPGVDTRTVIVKGVEGLAVVYLVGGSLYVCDWYSGCDRVHFEGLADRLGTRVSAAQDFYRGAGRRRGMSSDKIVILCFV